MYGTGKSANMHGGVGLFVWSSAYSVTVSKSATLSLEIVRARSCHFIGLPVVQHRINGMAPSPFHGAHHLPTLRV